MKSRLKPFAHSYGRRLSGIAAIAAIAAALPCARLACSV